MTFHDERLHRRSIGALGSACLAVTALLTCRTTHARTGRDPVDRPFFPTSGRSVEVDPGFPYYQGRTLDSVAKEIRANGYRVVRYILTADSAVNPRLIDAFHRQGIGVWYSTFGNGVYTTRDLPAGWQAWKMVTRSDLERKPLDDGYTRLCLNNPDYRAWKKAQIARMLKAHPFQGVDIMEPHWPEYPGIESPVYACFCPHCLAAFHKMFPGEENLPDILHPDSPRSPQHNPTLWRKWLAFRQASLTGFLNDLVNGPGGIRRSAPSAKVCVWMLALSGPDGVKHVREDSGEDAADIARTVKPDVLGLQTHWPDWTRTDLPPIYVNDYRPFIDEARAAAPNLPLMIQADTGSQKQNRRDWAWIHAFERVSAALGVDSTTLYEYFIGRYMYTDPPRIAGIELRGGAIELSFTKRLDPKTAGDAARYHLDRGKVVSAKVDGSLVRLQVKGAPAGESVALTVRGIADAADKRLFNDMPAAILREQTVRFAMPAVERTQEISYVEPTTMIDIKPALTRTANEILSHQVADGAIVMNVADAEQKIIPYFSSFAAYGLVRAYGATHDRRYLDSAKRWAEWYGSHEDKDGTVRDYVGKSGSWKSTGHYDSTDSYAATYIDLVNAIHKASPEEAWLRERYPTVLGAIAAIRLTMQPNGLTLATPTWPVMYTMDNTETLQGLRSAAEIARALKETKHAQEFTATADHMESSSYRDLWDDKRDCYRIGIQPDGGKMEGLEKWYPDVMAQLMAVAWLPRSERNKALFARLKVRFGGDLPTAIHSEHDLDRLVWWGLAARGIGDHEMAERIIRTLVTNDAGSAAAGNPAYLGHICRILAEPPPTAQSGHNEAEH